MPASRRGDLIDAAMRVFSREGFHAPGLERVLEEGQLSRMTIYSHFKSKDELIIAALQRKDELARARLTEMVSAPGLSSRDRVLAVFDFLIEWFGDPAFCGCMFIHAASEFGDPASGAHRAAATHKWAVVNLLADLAAAAGVREPQRLADELSLIFDGAIARADVLARAGIGGTPVEVAHLARRLAAHLLDAATATAAG